MPNYKEKSTPPKSFDAEIELPNGSKRIMRNCTIYNGVVVQLVSVGQGKKTEKAYWSPEGDADVVEEWEYYAYIPRPIYLANHLPPAQKQEMVRLDEACAKKKDYTECFNQYKQYMPIMGKNPTGHIVRNMMEVEEQKIRENKTLTIYYGFRGLKIAERMPSDSWAKIKHLATFYKKEVVEEFYEDTDDFERVSDAGRASGWNYKVEIIPILKDLGYKVMYFGREIQVAEDIDKVDQEISKAYNETRAKERARAAKAKELNERINALPKQEIPADDCERVSELPRLTFQRIGWQGSDIYGGGKWFAKDDKYLYPIHNNGMDGDFWGANNIRTGGAGAIGKRVELTPEIIDLLEEIQNFEDSTEYN